MKDLRCVPFITQLLVVPLLFSIFVSSVGAAVVSTSAGRSAAPSSASRAATASGSIDTAQIAAIPATATAGALRFGQLPPSFSVYGNPPQISNAVVSDGALADPNLVKVHAAEVTDLAKIDGQASLKSQASGSGRKTAEANPTQAAVAAAEVGDLAAALNGAAPASIAKRQATTAGSSVGPPTTAAQALSLNAAAGVLSNVLIIATDSAKTAAVSILEGLGTKYTIFAMPAAGAVLPTMESTSGTVGQFNAIVIISAVAYNYPGYGYGSALSPAQLTMLYNYQLKYKVRMVQLGIYPTVDLGVQPFNANGGCCNANVLQNVTMSDTTMFHTAGIVTGAQLETTGLWHYPATIVDTASTKPFMTFGASSDGSWPAGAIAGVISNFTSGREQMSIFLDTASWSSTSNVLSHAWFTWATRGLYPGYRRVYFQQQVDDLYLSTENASISGGKDAPRARLLPTDLDNHITWSADLLKNRMNTGSSYQLEMAFNGNGVAEEAYNNDATELCAEPIELDDPEYAGPLEFQKPLGSGTNYWPTRATYAYTLACAKKDGLGNYFSSTTKLNAFMWVSHTFTHENLNNATYADTLLEMQFNQKFASQMSITKATKWSAKGLVPPAITGMHNGDALRAMKAAGITNVVGDNSRSVLRNTANFHYPYLTTVANNGFAGIQITPRWPTNIYYNASDVAQNLELWQYLTGYGPTKTMNDLLWYEASISTNYLISLYHDAFMFHQINMRVSDLVPVTVNGITKQYSLLQMWTEVVVKKFNSLVNWPMVAIKHDDLATAYANRMTRDQCKVAYTNNISGKSIVGITVTPTGTCAAPIPVTLPGPVVSSAGYTTEQLGKDPLTIWVNFASSTAPVTFVLKTPIPA